MRIIIAPDSFKESMTALEAAEAIEKGFKKVFPHAQFIKIPMADGGEGTVQSLVDATRGVILEEVVTGPLGTPVKAFYGLSGDGKTAIIEMAAASGLELIKPHELNPLITTTKGTGELIISALNQGVEHIIIGIGGSATNDGGAGMAQALGVRFLDKEQQDIKQGGGELEHIHSIDISKRDPRLKDVTVEVACDVNNPLTGDQGAAAIFGPQKGATNEMVKILDKNLSHYAAVIERDLKIDIKDTLGSGAAGGLGGGLMAFMHGKLKPGIDIVIETIGLERAIKDASLVITGEGRIDYQTIYGKTPIGVAKLAKRYGIPVIAVAGSLGENYQAVYAHGIDVVFSIVPSPMTLEDAIQNAEIYTEKLAENIARTLKISKLT